MITTGPKQTPLQMDFQAALAFYNRNGDMPSTAVTAINNYINIVNTPSVANLITLINTVETALSSAATSSTLNKLNVFKTLALSAYESLKIGNPQDAPILAGNQYPEDDLGVTYTSILNDLKANLQNNDNIDTVEHFAATIFYTINALNPRLTLEQLTADIQATVDAGATFTSLVNNITTELDNITNPSAFTIKTAIYGNNIFSADATDLAADITAREKLLNLIQIKENLLTICSNSASNNASFGNAIYNSLLGLDDHLLSASRIIRDVKASVASLGSLATLKANIVANLNNTDDLDITIASLKDALFANNALIPSDSHDLRMDLPSADYLLGLQYIRTALIDATNNFSGNATQLARALLSAITDNGGGRSLTLAELVNDIKASGDVNTLASNIHNALSALNPNTLTASTITGALYDSTLIISGHKKDLLDDLVIEEAILNYDNMRSTLIDNIDAASSVDELVQGIYDNINVNDTNALSQSALQADIQATINAGKSLSSLKTALMSALNLARPTADDINAALYGSALIISADPANLTADINAAETAIDYRTLITNLKTVCNKVINGNITTATVFVQNLKSVLSDFSGQQGQLDQASLANEIEFNISNNISGNLISIATSIKNDLITAANNKDYTSLAIDTAIFDNINPSHQTRFVNDARTTETHKNLLEIKTAIITACEAVSQNTQAVDFADALLLAVENNTTSTLTLSASDLTKDITATLVSQGISITDLAVAIKANLNGILHNALTGDNLKNALYNSNAIIVSNPHDMGLDITDSAFRLTTAAVKQNLLNYLQPLYDNRTDISSITLSKGILSILKGNYSGPELVSAVHLNADISYTISQDENDLGDGNYEIINMLITALNRTGSTPQNVVDALFSADTIIVAPGNEDANLRDKDNLLTYINASENAQSNYSAVRGAIVDELKKLTSTCTSQDLAQAIVNGIGATAPNLSLAQLEGSISVTQSTPIKIAKTLITNLKGLTAISGADDIVNVIFATGTSPSAGSGPLANSLLNAASLLESINLVTDATNDYQAIIDKITDNLSSLSDGYSADDVAQAIINGLDYIASGANGSILNTKLSKAQILDDINLSLGTTTLSILVSHVIDNLNSISGGNISAGGIAGVIYNVNNGISAIAETNANVYNSDLQDAVTAHSSMSIIQNNFKRVGAYGSSVDLANAILNGIKSETGITTSLTMEKLAADIDDTLSTNDKSTLKKLANGAFEAIYNSGSATTVNNMVNGVFGNNILTTINAHLAKQDLVSYKLYREPTFYSNIVTSFIENFAPENSTNYDTKDEFANLAVNTLNLQQPTWTTARVRSDVEAGSLVAGSYTALGSNLYNALTTAAPTTAAGIANVIYSASNLVLSKVDADAATNSIDANFSLYGGATGLASLVDAALAKLSSACTATDIARAIVQTITPVVVNPSPHLSVEDMANDILFTQIYSSISLTDLVAAIRTALVPLILDSSTSANGLDDAIYSANTIVASDSDENNFEVDITNAIQAFNDFATVQSALETIASSTADNAAGSVRNDLLLSEYQTNFDILASEIDNSVLTTLADLVGIITNNVHNADVSNVTSAAKNLALAFFNKDAVMPANSMNLGADIVAADSIDNAVTITSAIGGNGVCTNGATHVVYSCSMVNNVAVVGPVIAVNDCTISGAKMAENLCDKWASQAATDFYVSYDGITCSDYLGDTASSYCKAGLDHLAV